MGTKPQAGLPGVRIPTGVIDISANCPEHFWGPNIHLQNKNKGFLLEASCSVCEFHYVPPLQARLRMNGSSFLFPLHAFMA